MIPEILRGELVSPEKTRDIRVEEGDSLRVGDGVGMCVGRIV